MSHRNVGRAVVVGIVLTLSLGLLGPPAAAAPSDTHSIGNFVWRDYGSAGPDNGVFNPGNSDFEGELGAEDVLVELLGSSGTLIAEQTTTQSGNYRFDGLPAGTYRVRLAARNFVAGGVLRGTQSSLDIGSTDMTRTGNATDHGLDDGTDPAAVGITSGPVTLGAADPFGDLSPYDDYVAEHGPNGDGHDNLVLDFGVVPRLDYDLDVVDAAPGPHPVGSTVTLETTLHQLGPGHDEEDGLQVHLDTPQDWTFLAEEDDDECFGWDPDGLPPGTAPTSFGFGVGSCLYDEPHFPSPGPGWTFTFSVRYRVDAVPSVGAWTTRAQVFTGEYDTNALDNTVTLLIQPPPVSGLLAVGDRVWVDDDADGVQDPAEGGAPGVRVELLDDQSRPAVDDQGKPVPAEITDVTGHFLFDGLRAGSYRLLVRRDASSTSAPLGYGFTQGQAGDASLDSDTGTTGISPVFALAPSSPHVIPSTSSHINAKYIDKTVDAGLQPLFALGNRVWLDADADGRQDPGEASLAGAQVRLTTAGGQPARHGDGSLVKPVRTAANGYYILTGLPRGRYVVTISDIRLCPPVTPTCSVVPPTGGTYRFSPTRAAGATGATNSDVGPDGRSKPVLLAVGAPDVVEADTTALDAVWRNSTVDAGVVLT